MHITEHLGSVTGGECERVPEASACAVSGSVSGPVSAPSCPGLGSRPWTSSFTVYTNNSIYKGITPEKRRVRRSVRRACDLLMSRTRMVRYHFLKLPGCLMVCWKLAVISPLFPDHVLNQGHPREDKKGKSSLVNWVQLHTRKTSTNLFTTQTWGNTLCIKTASMQR